MLDTVAISPDNVHLYTYIYICIGTAQFSLQTIVSILLLTYWDDPREDHVIKDTLGHEIDYNVLLVIHTILAAIALLSFSSLCIFHAYLQASGMGTYDWILSKRTPANPAANRPATSNAGRPLSVIRSNSSISSRSSPSPAAALGGGGGGGVAARGNGEENAGHVSVSIPPSSGSKDNNKTSDGPAAAVVVAVQEPTRGEEE